jgi:shikimate kinase
MAGDEPASPVADRHLVFVGLMGTGKTTVGAVVADRLGRTFVDLDDVVATREGRSVRQLLADDGGDAFRAAEAAALADVLASPDPLVVATGGGAVLDARSRRLLAASPLVVWLQAPTAVLVSRVAGEGAPDRPLLDDGPAVVLERLGVERGPLYAEVADLSVDSASDDPAGVADSVLAAIAGGVAGVTS